MTTGYRRLLLKLSGEGLAGKEGFGIHPFVISGVAEQIREIHDLGVQISLVIGGGNIIRGMAAAAQRIDRVQTDYMGASSTRWRCRMHSKKSGFPRGFRPRSKSYRSRRPTSGDGRSASSRKVGS